MAHIQRGNEREYFSNQLSGNEVSEGIRAVGETLAGVFNGAQDVVNKANESKLSNYQVDLSTKFLEKNNEINTKYQSDPTNPDREKELKEAFENLSGQYKVNPLVSGQWAQIKNNVYNNYKDYNAKWQLQQQQTNAEIDLKNGYENSIKQASMLGTNGTDIEQVRLIFNNNEQALERGVSAKQLGSVQTQEALKSHRHDFMAMYLQGVMQNDPSKAIALLNQEDVVNDLGDADSTLKLKQTAQQYLLKKTEVDAVNRTADYINQNHDLFQKVYDGTISITEAQKILNDKNVDKNMRNVISSMLGYSTRSKYYVDGETGKITKMKTKSGSSESSSDGYDGSGSQSSSNNYAQNNELVIGEKKWTFSTAKGKSRQPNTQEKEEIKNELYLRGSQLLNNVEGKTPQQSIRKIAEFQSQVAQASYFGLGQSDYNKLMNTFVLPATKNIQEQAKNYNANIHQWGRIDKYGYQQIDKYFTDFSKNLEDTKSNRDLIAKEQALASVYYWSGLNSYCSQNGISMQDLQNMDRHKTAGIYKKYAENAVQKAKINTTTPELWFRSMNPQYVSSIRTMLPNDRANNVITNVAVATLTNPNMTDKDYQNIINKEIRNEYAKLRTTNRSVALGGNTKYDEIINLYAMQNKIDPLLVKCVIKQESGFNANAKSNAGAGGLMQLMPATASRFGCKNVNDPKQNVQAGTKYLAYLLNKHNGNVPLALASYNAGEGNVKKYGNKIPPYQETRNYVKNVMAMYNKARG